MIYLVACSAGKLSEPAQAADLYTSQLFRKSRAWVEACAGWRDSWYILSAKHGLVHPSRHLAPYDLSLNDLPAPKRRAWAARVNRDLDDVIGRSKLYSILAGVKYREYIVPHLETFARVHVPMEGMGIGRQLQYLSRDPYEPRRG